MMQVLNAGQRQWLYRTFIAVVLFAGAYFVWVEYQDGRVRSTAIVFGNFLFAAFFLLRPRRGVNGADWADLLAFALVWAAMFLCFHYIPSTTRFH